MKVPRSLVIVLLLVFALSVRGAEGPQGTNPDSVATDSLAALKSKLRTTLNRHLNELLGTDGSVRAMKGKTSEGNGALAFYLMFEVTGEPKFRKAALSLADQVLKDMRATKFGVLPIKEKDKPGGATIIGGGPPALGAYTSSVAYILHKEGGRNDDLRYIATVLDRYPWSESGWWAATIDVKTGEPKLPMTKPSIINKTAAMAMAAGIVSAYVRTIDPELSARLKHKADKCVYDQILPAQLADGFWHYGLNENDPKDKDVFGYFMLTTKELMHLQRFNPAYREEKLNAALQKAQAFALTVIAPMTEPNIGTANREHATAGTPSRYSLKDEAKRSFQLSLVLIGGGHLEEGIKILQTALDHFPIGNAGQDGSHAAEPSALILSSPLLNVPFAGQSSAVSIAAARKPNILILVGDDLGYGELGCQGYTQQIPTPNIDSIAKKGVRFTNGYVSGPYCSPTRAGLMTGRYQQRFGHEFNPGEAQGTADTIGLPLQEKTIGDRFKAIGYTNGWFGKSHLGYAPHFHPLKRGFDDYFGFLGGKHDYLDAEGEKHNPILRGTTPVKDLDYTTDAFGREAVRFIEQHRAGPWLCYLAFNAVHMPLEATKKYLSRFPNLADPKRRTYAAMQSAMDDAIGAVFQKIRDLGQEENTLIFFFSDNGGPTPSTTSSNGPLRGVKSQTWEGGIRIPFMIQWKGHLPAGKVDDRPVIQLDILPTALAAAGVAAPPEWKLDGVNLLPYLRGEKTGAPHDVLYWRFGQQIALRKGDWKLVKAPLNDAEARVRGGKGSTVGAQLYNLRQDIGETENLAAKFPEKLQELSAMWEKMNREMVAPQWGHNSSPAEK
jgi:arylsulfatase A-like enzyme